MDSDKLRQAIDSMRQTLGDRLSTSVAVRAQHGKDQTWNEGASPDAVAFVTSTAETQAIVGICARFGVPVIPYGTGTSLELSGMNSIIEVNAEDMDCRVEAGVTRKQLNTFLRDKGLFFPVDPGADASIGGMTATRASGTNAVRYGTMKDSVLGLTVVKADAEAIRTGTRARKSSAGYDLTRLFVGSEGTLGVITEIQLKLHGIPEAIVAGVCQFPSVEACCNTAMQTIQMGIPIARIELVDAENIKAINAYSHLGLAEVPTLFLEFHGTTGWADEQARLFADIAREFGGSEIAWARDEEGRTKLWQARHDSFWASKAMMPGMETLATDICVPISRLADCVRETQKDLADNNLYGPIIGHIGDGNFHVGLFWDPAQDAEKARIKQFYDRLVARALAMGGTCTGEHGIGSGKRKYMAMEHGPALATMRAIKKALDPHNIMNPGKSAGIEAI
jgi:D-lactate dehydrogenase (cytochrome)